MIQDPRARPLTSAELYEAHAAFVARYLYRLGVPAALVEDAVQEVFLVVHQRGGYAPGPAKPTSYLAAIAVNAASRFRQKARRLAARTASDEVDGFPSQFDAPDHGLDAHDKVSLVRLALARLDPNLGATLLLADGEEESCVSIAAAMGVPLGTVYWRLHRARAKFAAALKVVEAEQARPARSAHPQDRTFSGAPAHARRAAMGIFWGWNRDAFRDSQAYALLRETRDCELPWFDAAAGHARHLADVARGAPLPAWASLPHASGLGGAIAAQKGPLLLAAGGVALGALVSLGALQLGGESPRANASTEASAVRDATPPAVATPSAPSVASLLEDTDTRSARDPRPHTTPTAVSRSAEPHERTHVQATHAARSREPRAVADVVAEALAAVPSTSAIGLRAQERASTPRERQPEPAPATRPPEPQPEAPRPQQVDALQILATAERSVRSDPERALELLRAAESSASSGYLAEEFAFVALTAHFHAGHREELERRAKLFLTAYPASAFASRVRGMQAASGASR